MPGTNTSHNPHFEKIHRAPYELGYLLQRLPEDFSPISDATADAVRIAEAAAEHAANANLVLLDGLAALGELMYVAGANLENRVSTESWAALGCMLLHIAVEALFLQETESALDYAVRCQRDKAEMMAEV
ncbi:MAG: hypothetical protein JWP38_752 [Herbaspirillum sp.]|nr:hypothetical protein [Herbaspirillum sp.]